MQHCRAQDDGAQSHHQAPNRAYFPCLQFVLLTCAVRSLVWMFCSAHTPSLLAKPSAVMRHLGRMRTCEQRVQTSQHLSSGL